MLTITNEDCMELMARYPDGYFDLAIVDPPYDVGASDGKFGAKKKDKSYNTLKHYANASKVPDKEYFDELFRISKHQIIWGANYYPQYLYHSGWIFWDKNTTGVLSDGELAFQSINKLVEKFDHTWTGFNKHPSNYDDKNRVHPNQKPVRLYCYLLDKYAQQLKNKHPDKPFRILDTHLGSGSIAIACHDYGYDLTACELDTDYYNAAIKRIAQHTSQLKLI